MVLDDRSSARPASTPSSLTDAPGGPKPPEIQKLRPQHDAPSSIKEGGSGGLLPPMSSEVRNARLMRKCTIGPMPIKTFVQTFLPSNVTAGRTMPQPEDVFSKTDESQSQDTTIYQLFVVSVSKCEADHH